MPSRTVLRRARFASERTGEVSAASSVFRTSGALFPAVPASIVNGSSEQRGLWVPFAMEAVHLLGKLVPSWMEGWAWLGSRDPLAMEGRSGPGRPLPSCVDQDICRGNAIQRRWKQESGEGVHFHSEWKPKTGASAALSPRSSLCSNGWRTIEGQDIQTS